MATFEDTSIRRAVSWMKDACYNETMKLLSYTSIRYLLFTALLLLLSIPVSYFVLNQIFTKATDRDLFLQANEIPVHLSHIESQRDLELWRALDKDLVIQPIDSVKRIQGPFTEGVWMKGEPEPQDFRVLQKEIQVLGKIYVVGIQSSLIEKEDLIRTILLIQLGLFCLMLAGAVLINYFINKKVWQPFYKTLSFLENFNLEKGQIEAPGHSKIQEFRQLNDSVYHLAIDVRRTFLNQKEFTENAAHELQTPLAVLQSKLELLLQDQELSQNQSSLIEEMYQVIERLEDLNTNLLFLSKMDNNQFTFNENFIAEAVTMEAAVELDFMMTAKSQQIAYDLPTQNLLQGNKDLFKIMITNLLRNAIQHGEKGSLIRVESRDRQLMVTNPGSPIDFDPGKIFHRFTKAGSQKGNGLGLAIAKKIAELHSWDLTYRYEAGYHQFQVNW